MKKLILTIYVVMASAIIIKSQNPYWRAGGNINFGPDPVNLANNFFGTQVGNNIPIRFGTNGTDQMFLRTNGFFGIGTIFSNPLTPPQSLLHIHDGGFSYLHVTNTASGSGNFQGVRFGLMGPTPHAVIAQQNAFNMYFITAGAAANLANVRMSIVGLAGPTQGFVGIGTSHTTPDNLLDVLGGDIDLETSTRSYMIRDSAVLWHKGNSSNIYVGTGAGFNQPLNTGLQNTYVGYRSGYTTTINDFENTFVGCEAGSNIQPSSTENVLIGLKTGQFMGGFHATYVGNRAGVNATGVNNSFYGFSSGRVYVFKPI